MNVFLYFLQTFTINFYFQCLIGHGQVVMCCLIRTPEMIIQIQETTTSGNTKIIIENFKKSEGMLFTLEKSSIEIDNTVNIICLIFNILK